MLATHREHRFRKNKSIDLIFHDHDVMLIYIDEESELWRGNKAVEMANLIREGVFVWIYIYICSAVYRVRHVCNQFVKNTMCSKSRSVYGTMSERDAFRVDEKGFFPSGVCIIPIYDMYVVMGSSVKERRMLAKMYDDHVIGIIQIQCQWYHHHRFIVHRYAKLLEVVGEHIKLVKRFSNYKLTSSRYVCGQIGRSVFILYCNSYIYFSPSCKRSKIRVENKSYLGKTANVYSLEA